MRAEPEEGMMVIPKFQEKCHVANPNVMCIESVSADKKTASVVGFATNGQPFKVDMKLVNLEKYNPTKNAEK